MKHLGVVLAVAVVVAACGEGASDTPATPAPVTTSPVTTSPVTTSPPGSDADALAGTSWVATAISGVAAIVGSEPTLVFDASAGVISGSTGCNQYSGEVVVGAGTLSVSGLSWTEMACMDAGVMDQESRFVAVLASIESFSLRDGVLEIVGGGGSVSFVAPEPVVDVPLEGTLWSLDTLVDGETATSVLATTLPTLRVSAAEGTTRGTTGCNDFGGRVDLSRGFVVSEMTWTEIGCEPAVMTQEAFVLEVLSAAVRYDLEGERLTISDDSGRALVYRAG